MGPVGLSGAYSVSENKGAVVSLGATYSGPLSLSAAYQKTNVPTTSEQQSVMYSLGAGYTMGEFTGKINFLTGKNKNVSLVETSNVEVLGLGLDWKTSTVNSVGLAYYSGKDKNTTSSTTNSFILSDEYALSKRTTLYVSAAFVDADANASLVSSIVAGGTDAGKNASLLNVGVKHSF
jgi:predicted porin